MDENKNMYVPLVVDLDGTLVQTDTLHESIIKLIKQSPFNLFRLFLWLLQGRAGFKASVADRVGLAAELLPYRKSLMDYLRNEKANGRRLVLATAAHHSIADRVASFTGLFESVVATTNRRNLKGAEKLVAIRETVGDAFSYAGDSPSDLAIWRGAQSAILAGANASVAKKVRRMLPVEAEFPNARHDFSVWMRALRLHQWLKNLLIFVPLFTAFSFLNFKSLALSLVAFLAFSIAASATYVLNDLWDLESDRQHPRKCKRPFASGDLSVSQGVSVAMVLLVLAGMLSLYVSKGFFIMLLTYLVLTTTYSWVLKQYVLIDVLMLSLLYTLRILAGSVALEIPTSAWLLAFSVFIFLSLALVKRCAELVSLEQSGKRSTKGRDYRVSDLVVLWPFGVGAALSAIVVFGLFINSTETLVRYATPSILWLVAVGLIYWLARLWIKTARGEMDDDPIVYAIKDRGSRVAVILMVAAVLAAYFVRF